MPDYYADFDLGTGSDDGSSAANAFQTFASMLAGGIAAGDEIWATGTETLASSISLSVGGNISSKIKLVSYNSDFSAYSAGSCIIDGNSAATNVINFNSQNGWWFKGVSFTGATSHGLTGATSWTLFDDCDAYSNGGDGFSMASGFYIRFNMTRSYNNTGYGFIGADHQEYSYCTSYGNNNGFKMNSSNTAYYRCLAYDNTLVGFEVDLSNILIGCIADDNGTDGFYVYDNSVYLSNCISTNNGGYGVNGWTPSGVSNGIAFYNNTSGEIWDTAKLVAIVPTTTLSGSPYENQAARNYTLTDDTIKGIEKDFDGTNKSFETYGLLPEYAAGGGGRQPRLRINGA